MSDDGSLAPSPEDQRRQARLAISELFLDTALDQADFLRLRDTLRAARLSPAELDGIYYDELAPILYRNLNTPAGAWSGFDAAWLEQEIQRVARRPGFPPLRGLRRLFVTRSTIKDWRRLRALVTAP